jgi:hypothetical protein
VKYLLKYSAEAEAGREGMKRDSMIPSSFLHLRIGNHQNIEKTKDESSLRILAEAAN